MISRRSFFTGAAATLITAPVIVRVGSLMPVKAIRVLTAEELYAAMIGRLLASKMEQMSKAMADAMIYGHATIDHGGGYAETILSPWAFTRPERYGLVGALKAQQQEINARASCKTHI